MPKDNSANSKSGSASSATATRRIPPGRNSNLASTQRRQRSSPVVASRRNQTELPRVASGRFNSGTLKDSNLPPAKGHKTNQTKTKTTTAKDKRQATLAAAEQNAARLRLTAEAEDQVTSEDDQNRDKGDRTRPFKALTFGNASDDANGDDDDDDDDDDDGDGNDDDDEEESPEAAHRPRLTRDQTVEDDEEDGEEDDEDLELDEAVGLENRDSDNDDPANSPNRQMSRKGKSAGATFTAPSTTIISSKLPAKVNGKKKTSKRGSDLRSPAAAGTAASSPSSATSQPKTPRKASVGTNRPRMYDQTPSTQGLLKASSSDVRQDLFVDDAFPERAVFTENCKATFLAACTSVQATIQRQRFLKSSTYRGAVLNILRQKLSSVRQEVRNAALAKTAIHYKIDSLMDPGDVKSRVDRLKTKIAYVFGDVDQCKRPYGNPLLQILINTLFFEGKRKSDAIANPVPWNPMPLPVIALVATAIHSVLDDWSSGKNDAAKNKFSHDKYAPIYRDHLANLEKFKQKAPAALSKLQISLWENAWLSTGLAFPNQGNIYIEDDVFAEAEAEALT